MNAWSLHPIRALLNLRINHCKLRFISSTGSIFNRLEQAVQNNYRLCKVNQDGTPNKWSPSSEIYVQCLIPQFKVVLQAAGYEQNGISERVWMNPWSDIQPNPRIPLIESSSIYSQIKNASIECRYQALKINVNPHKTILFFWSSCLRTF